MFKGSIPTWAKFAQFLVCFVVRRNEATYNSGSNRRDTSNGTPCMLVGLFDGFE